LTDLFELAPKSLDDQGFAEVPKTAGNGKLKR
jgi:hypothetical protein